MTLVGLDYWLGIGRDGVVLGYVLDFQIRVVQTSCFFPDFVLEPGLTFAWNVSDTTLWLGCTVGVAGGSVPAVLELSPAASAHPGPAWNCRPRPQK